MITILEYHLHPRFLLQILLLCCFVFILPNKIFCQTINLFESDEPLELKLQSDLSEILKDVGDDPNYHPATLMYQQDESWQSLEVEVKTRGNSRKNLLNCKYPPLFLNFRNSDTPDNSIFHDQKKTKLVTPCRGDQYIVNEYLVYKLYNLITEKSFNARLVKIVFEDTEKNKSSDPYFGMLLEEEKQVAKRNNKKSVEIEKLHPKRTQLREYLTMTVFQYMIGNTDWSVEYQQNIKLLTDDKNIPPYTVPYDFDNAGIVRTPYSKPAPELELSSTLVRRYRGYCVDDMKVFDPIFPTFHELKDQFYSIYENNEFISDSYRKQTIKFLDKFYETIENPKKAARDFLYPCDNSGTGNVIIQGLDN